MPYAGLSIPERRTLLARARVAQKLVADGQLEPEIALAYVVWPTAGILEREQRTPASTISFRATSYRNERAA